MIQQAVFRTARRVTTLPRRSVHQASAVFTSINSRGRPNECDVAVYLGDPHEAYVLIPPEIGHAFAAAARHERIPTLEPIQSLTYNHGSRSFTCSRSSQRLMSLLLTERIASTLLPKLTIPCGLPSQSTSPISPATLYLFGPNYTIALDGTPDGKHPLFRAYMVINTLSGLCKELQRFLA